MDNPWHVYGLIDPRNGCVFYIGITQNMERRYSQHHICQESSARAVCRDIAQAGAQVGRCVFGVFEYERMARFLERQLITCIPQTYNQTFFEDGLRLWEPLATEYGYRRQAEKAKP